MTQLLPLYDKNYECIMCKKPFTTKKVRSRFVKVDHYDSDFAPIYSTEINPTFYHVNVCPHCGFSFTDDFQPYFPPGSKEMIQLKVSSRWVSRDFGNDRSIEEAMNAYKLSIYCATLKKEKHIAIAGLHMRLSWLYRLLQNDEQESRFLKLAAAEYIESYMSDDFRGTQVSDVRILYLIGELSRRTGNMEQAIKYFSKVIEKQKQTVEPKIVEMAKERWYEIRDEKREVQELT